MSLAQLFFMKETFREQVRHWRQSCFRQRVGWSSIVTHPLRHTHHPSPITRHFLLEALEPRLLLSATPIEVVSPQETVLIEPSAVTVPAGSLPSLDVDLNGQADALTDGIVIIRHMFGFTGNTVVDGVVDPAGQRTDPAEITDYLISINSALDVDQNGSVDALSDGILILRYAFGFNGPPLVEGTVDPAGQRTDPATIETYLNRMNPERETIPPLLVAGLQADTGLSITDTITFNPTITGTIADINQIAAFTAGFDDTPVDGFVDVLADLQANGTFTLTPSRLDQVAGGTLADGAHVLHLRATDARGNVSILDHTFTLDTLAPTAPVLDLLAMSDSGASSTDDITNITEPSIEVLTDPGHFQLTINGVQQIDINPVDTAFTFTFTTQLPDGPGIFIATLEDVAGNVASAVPLAILVDTVAPALPTFDLDPAFDTLPFGDHTTSESVVTLQGTTEPHAILTLTEKATTGLDFPGSAAVDTTMRFKFDHPELDGLPIYGPGGAGVTYIWNAYVRQQAGYYTAFFWGNDDGKGNVADTFLWKNGSADTYYGAHPYPDPPPDENAHQWEISIEQNDFLNGVVVYDRWYTQVLRVWADESGIKHHEFYWDLPNTDASHVVSVDLASSYGNLNPPAPALTWGDAPWNPGAEVWDGILRGIQIYATNLSLTDIQREIATPLSTEAGSASIWYLNLNPTPTDISDKSGMGHDPAWVGSERPTLYALVVDPVTSAADSVGNFSISSVALVSGVNALMLQATDIAGNVSDVTQTIIWLQKQMPVSSLLVLPSESVTAETSYAIASQNTAADSLAGLDVFRSHLRFDGIFGAGMTVVIIDTGIDIDHPFFGPDADDNGVADRIVFQWDFADNDADASDRNGHGSHIASLIGSEDLTYPGVAPEANLIALKVFSDTGTGTFAYVEQALQWVAAHAAEYSIDVVNLSLGDGQNWTTPDSHYGLGDEFAALANDSILVLAAAGNNFFTARSQPGVSYPAADPNVIGVGAVWTQDFGGPWRWSSGAIDLTTGTDRIASFSQRDATMTEIFAPGARLVGANQLGGTVTMQGTSQAAAYLSGTALLAQQMAEDEWGRKLTPQEFTDLVVATGKKIVDGDDEQDNVVNTGLTFARVDILQLVRGIDRYENRAGEEEGHHHRDYEFALAYTQRCWVKDFVSESSTATDEAGEEFLIALPA